MAFVVLAVAGCGDDDEGGGGGGCEDCDAAPDEADAADDGPQTVDGETLEAFGGDLTAYAVVDDDVVTQVGLRMSAETVAGAAASGAATFEGFALDFPDEAQEQTVFAHAFPEFTFDGIGFGAYVVPFWLTHYYMIDKATREAVTCPQAADIDPDEIPEDYFEGTAACSGDGGTSIAGEGRHMPDLAAPEQSGGDFTYNMWIVFAEGDLVSLEPFITNEVLEAEEGFTLAVRQPVLYPAAAVGKLFPTTYTGEFRDGDWYLYFSNFETVEAPL